MLTPRYLVRASIIRVIRTTADPGVYSWEQLIATREHRYGRLRAQVYAFLRECGWSFPKIGHFVGGKDHTTVMHGVSNLERYGKFQLLEALRAERARDVNFRLAVERLANRGGQEAPQAATGPLSSGGVANAIGPEGAAEYTGAGATIGECQ